MTVGSMPFTHPVPGQPVTRAQVEFALRYPHGPEAAHFWKLCIDDMENVLREKAAIDLFRGAYARSKEQEQRRSAVLDLVKVFSNSVVPQRHSVPRPLCTFGAQLVQKALWVAANPPSQRTPPTPQEVRESPGQSR